MAVLKERTLLLWHKLGKKERLIFIVSAALIVIAIIFSGFWWTRTEYTPLFTNMDAKDAGEVAAKLKEAKIPYEIGGNGSAILVPAKDVYKVRLDMASQGLPRGSKGFEIFDQNKFGTTEFQNKVYYLQALQGELTRTIEQMSEVEKARVHIVLPEDSLYKKNEKPATASIMLTLRPSTQLSREQVKGIVNLVAHSIQGLKQENVTIVDNFAHVLNDQSDSSFMAGAGTLTQIELTKKVQEDLQKNIQSLLEQVLGPGKAAARVNVELSFDQRTVDRQVFEPVVDDKGIIRSSQDTSETYKGTSPASGGVPGTATNIPGYVTASGNSQSSYEKKDSTKNYEINETKEKLVVAPGAIKRMTVAVLVDAAVTNVQQDSISKTVASAIGLNPNRGDIISVETVAFNTELADKQRKEELSLEQQQNQLYWLKIGGGVLGIFLVVYLVRLLARRRQQEEDLEVVSMIETQSEETSATVPKELTKQEQERIKQREDVEALARNNPQDVAQLVKAWLSEE